MRRLAAAMLLVCPMMSVAHDIDLVTMSKALYFEARSESDVCQRKIASVILNRVSQARFPDSLVEVIHQKKWSSIKRGWICQFSYYCDGKPDEMTNWSEMLRATGNASWALSGAYYDMANGADHYYAQDKVYPDWAPLLKNTEVCDGHTFGSYKW